MTRIIIRIYAVVVYVVFLVSLASFIGWMANVGVPRGIDDGSGTGTWVAVAVDCGLLGLFAVQHSVMARPWFKSWSRSLIPPAAERATYVLSSTAAVTLIIVGWQPLESAVWTVDSVPWRAFLWVVYGLGWSIVVISTFMIGHWDMFGLRQALQGPAYREPGFGRPGFYALVRHPIMTGFVIAFWATPKMTVGHALLAAMSTAYIVLAVRFEESDLRARLGSEYSSYAAEVPRFVPALSLELRRVRLEEERGPASPYPKDDS